MDIKNETKGTTPFDNKTLRVAQKLFMVFNKWCNDCTDARTGFK
jgi:hypothetical protein